MGEEIVEEATETSETSTETNTGTDANDENLPEEANEEEPTALANSGIKEKEEEPVEKKNHNQRRWEKLVQERGKAIGEAAELRRQLAEARGHTNQPKPQEEEAVPKRDQFQTDEDYVGALVEYKTNQKMSNVHSDLQQSQQKAQAQKSFLANEAAIRKTIPDYDEVIESSSDVMIPQAALDAILFSEHGAAIRYHLAKNPEEAENLNTLGPIAAVKEIGKLEARIEFRTKGKKSVTGAPEPIKPAGTGRGKVNVDRDKLTDDQWRKQRAKERAARLRK